MKTMSLPSAMPFFSVRFISFQYCIAWRGFYNAFLFRCCSFKSSWLVVFFFARLLQWQKNSVWEFLCKIEGKIYLSSNRTHNRIIYTKHMNVIRWRQLQCLGENNTHNQVLIKFYSSFDCVVLVLLYFSEHFFFISVVFPIRFLFLEFKDVQLSLWTCIIVYSIRSETNIHGTLIYKQQQRI